MVAYLNMSSLQYPKTTSAFRASINKCLVYKFVSSDINPMLCYPLKKLYVNEMSQNYRKELSNNLASIFNTVLSAVQSA